VRALVYGSSFVRVTSEDGNDSVFGSKDICDGVMVTIEQLIGRYHSVHCRSVSVMRQRP
jgi:hypothetical protein